MLNFAALPPEVNSARMYAGPGSGPMMAAATAWDELAVQLESFVSGYSGQLTTLQGQHWSGPASTAMAAAAAPYLGWANTTAAQAEQTANQARAAAAAYEAAFAATVPPPVVEANRALLTALIATNFFGQNTPAIAATDAFYAEMWAQDAAAMYGYAATSLPAAATLTPFTPPPQTTNPGGQPAQSAAAAHAVGTAATQTMQTALAHALAASSNLGQSVANSGTATATSSSGSSAYFYIDNLQTYLQFTNLLHSSILAQYYNYGVTIGDQGMFNTAYLVYGQLLGFPRTTPPLLGTGGGALAAGATNATGGSVPASTAKAASVGTLSVPQGWAGATPAAKTGYLAQSLESQSSEAGQRAESAELVSAKSAAPMADQPPMQPVMGPIGGAAARHSNNSMFRMRDRRWRMPRPAVGG